MIGVIRVLDTFVVDPDLLVGAEADMSWSAASGNYNFITTLADSVTNVSGIFNSNQNWYSTAAGRVGYVIGNYMLYAKGGGAWMNADYSLAVTGPFAGGSANLTRSGYVAGGYWMTLLVASIRCTNSNSSVLGARSHVAYNPTSPR